MKPLFSLLCLCFFACQTSQNLHRNTAAVNAKLPGQTAPNDMIFVPGNGDIAPFYISVSEEPNINYITYLLWIKAVWGESYPEVVEAAIPKSAKFDQSDQYIDAFVDAYLTNPAYAYYPVTNLTWKQIENYLVWKTDRLNEYILIENKILNFNPEQKDEDNFNTEAYLAGQYQGDVRRNIPTKYMGERPVKFNDGVLFTGFRLPTEKEWDYVANNPSLQKKKGKSKKRAFHPYGEDYYPLLWLNHLSGGSNYDDYDSALPVGMNTYPHELKKLKSPNKEILAAQRKMPSNLSAIEDYDAKSYGVIHMEDGVQEWLLNEYQEQVSSKNWLMVFKEGGFLINDQAVRDAEGRYIEKDSLGRMRNFRFIDVDPSGRPYEVERYHPKHSTIELLWRQKKKLEAQIKQITPLEPLSKDLRELSEQLLKRKKEIIEKLQKEIPEITDANRLFRARRQLESLINNHNSIAYRVPFYKKETEKLEAKIEAINLRIHNLKQKSFKTRQRVVKGGDWKKPGQQRRALAENEAAANVGFRVILPYTGAPLKKEHKVKWGNKLTKTN